MQQPTLIPICHFIRALENAIDFSKAIFFINKGRTTVEWILTVASNTNIDKKIRLHQQHRKEDLTDNDRHFLLQLRLPLQILQNSKVTTLFSDFDNANRVLKKEGSLSIYKRKGANRVSSIRFI